MEFKKGSARVVFIFPHLGLVIKLSRFYVWIAFKTFWKYTTQKKYWGLLKKWFTYDVVAIGGFKYLLCRGLRDNWHEYKYYTATKQVFLQPTYFSLFGFLNVQKYGEYQKMPFDILLHHFMDLTNGEAFKDAHHFASSRNFCFEKGKIKITDYGSSRTQEIITKWGEKIVADFDIEKILKKEVEAI